MQKKKTLSVLITAKETFVHKSTRGVTFGHGQILSVPGLQSKVCSLVTN